MGKSYNRIICRVYKYFERKNKGQAVTNTVNFMTLLQASVFVPLFFLLSLFANLDSISTSSNPRLKYYIGIPAAIVLLVINSRSLNRKLKSTKFKPQCNPASGKAFILPLWIIFALPVVFVFISPIIFGLINGTLSVPLLNR